MAQSVTPRKKKLTEKQAWTRIAKAFEKLSESKLQDEYGAIDGVQVGNGLCYAVTKLDSGMGSGDISAIIAGRMYDRIEAFRKRHGAALQGNYFWPYKRGRDFGQGDTGWVFGAEMRARLAFHFAAQSPR